MHKPVAALLVLLAAAAMGGTTARAGSPTFGTRDAISPEISSNWSGYALVAPDTNPLAFGDVTGTWVEPKAHCTAGRRDASAFWVGLGGYSTSSDALEQLGTAAECDGSSTTASHYAWWEVVPAASVKIPLRVFPGDTITAAVVVKGQTIVFSLRNVTRQTRFSKIITTSQALDVGSAEWIAEAPSDCSGIGRCTVVPLTNFGTVTFTKAAAIANDHPGTIVDPTWTPSAIELITRSSEGGLFGQLDAGGVGALPGDVSTDGRSFSVSWQSHLTPPTG